MVTLTKTILGFGPQGTTAIELLLLTNGTHPWLQCHVPIFGAVVIRNAVMLAV